MVETLFPYDFMRSLFLSRASALLLLPASSSSLFAFASCMQGWYYRCLGLDPVNQRNTMLLSKQKKNQNANSRRLLISINVFGSAGPIRFVVNEEDLVAAVIDTALKSYAREGRLPLLGSDNNAFCLYCPRLGSDALSPWDTIGSHGARNFVLCKKPQATNEAAEDGSGTAALSRRGSGSWKAWFNKSLNLKISSH